MNKLTLSSILVLVFSMSVSAKSTAKLVDNGQLLRVPHCLAKPENRAAFWQALEAHPGAFSELALFTPSATDEAQTLAFHGKDIDDVRDFVAEAKSRNPPADLILE